MRLLDLFCGAGGATRGYQQAGFHVIGVDVNPQPDYCGDDFLQMDAMGLIETGLEHAPYDAIHASPPCQLFTRASHLRDAQGSKSKESIDLLTPTLDAFAELEIPWVVENVPGAPFENHHTIALCGSMFGLPVQRHRVFASNMLLTTPGPCRHDTFPVDPVSGKPRPIGVYHVLNDEVPKGGKTARTLEEAQAAMGIEWMPWRSLKESIPPAYTEWIGRQLIAAERAA